MIAQESLIVTLVKLVDRVLLLPLPRKMRMWATEGLFCSLTTGGVSHLIRLTPGS
jgi:hypothetical protein